jgi:hypothetical protein
MTELEVVKIHEAAETKRKELELKSRDRLDARAKRYEAWRSSELTLPAIVMLPVLGVVGSLCAVAIMYFHHLWMR